MSQTFFTYREGDEPIPGCRLSHYLGGGTFGQVWKARRPGNVEVALKIINLQGQQAFREFESLRLVKNLRHPHLIPIHGFWMKDDESQVFDDAAIEQLALTVGEANKATQQVRTLRFSQPAELLIEMGLGQNSLNDRLKECAAQNQAGLPVDELLEYMIGAAKGLDFLNFGETPIVHGDVKPHNIMLVGGEAAVCDFGLARAVENLRMTGQGPLLTVAYAAPETFKGQHSDRSDQYSLAITYFELRTGGLPFGEVNSTYEVMATHVEGRLLLNALPKSERKIIQRATQIKPDRRWASSRQMVEELRKAIQGEPTGRSPILPRIPLFKLSRSTAKAVGTDDGFSRATIVPAKADTTPTEPPQLTEGRIGSWDEYVSVAPAPAARFRWGLALTLVLLIAVGASGWVWRNELLTFWPAPPPAQEDNAPPPKAAPLDFSAYIEELIAKEHFSFALETLQRDAPLDFPNESKRKLTEQIRVNWLAKAQLHRESQFQRAVDLCDQILDPKRFPGDVESRLTRARACLRSGDQANFLRARQDLHQLSITSLDTRLQPLHRVLSLLVSGADAQVELLKLADVVDLLVAPYQPTSEFWQVSKWEHDKLAEQHTALAKRVLQLVRSQPSELSSAQQLLSVAQQLQRLKLTPSQSLDVQLLKIDCFILQQQWSLARTALDDMAAVERQVADISQTRQATSNRAIVELSDPAADEQRLSALLAKAKQWLPTLTARQRLAVSTKLVEYARTHDEHVELAVELLRASNLTLEGELKPLLATMLARRIELFVARLSQPTASEYRQIIDDCLHLESQGGSNDLTRTCHAECLLALERESDKAKQLLGAVKASGGYISFVRAVGNSKSAADWLAVTRELSAAFSGDATAHAALKAPYRRQQAQTLMIESTRQLSQVNDVPSLMKRAGGKLMEAALAQQLYDLLKQSSDWSSSPSLPLKAALVVAGWSCPKPDSEPITRYAAELLNAKGSAAGFNPVQVSWVLMHAATNSVGRIDAGTRLLSLLPTLPRVDAAVGVEFYRQVIVPIVEQADQEFNSQRRTPQLAEFYGATGDFVWSHRQAEEWRTEPAIQTNALLEELYKKAMQADGTRWQYIVAHGEALMQQTAESLPPAELNRLLEEVLRDADAAAAIAGGGPRGRGLRGHRNLLVARRAPSSVRAAEFKKAVDDLSVAVAELPLNDQRRAEYLLYLSTARTERANTLFSTDLNAATELLQGAATAANDAVQMQILNDRPYVEYLYRTLGNAHEDLAWLMGVDINENYGLAVRAFRSAIEANEKHQQAHRDLGRCYVKILEDSRVDLAALNMTRDEMLRDALDHLNKAASELAKIPAETTDAHRWLAAAHVVGKQYERADEEFSIAVSMARQHRPANVGDFLYNQAKAALQHATIISQSPTATPDDLTDAVARVRKLANDLGQVQLIYGGQFDPRRESALLVANAYKLENRVVDSYKQLEHLAIPAPPTPLTATDAEVLRFRSEVRDKLPSLALTLEVLKAAREDARLLDRPGVADERKAIAYDYSASIANRLAKTTILRTASSEQVELHTNCLSDLAKAIEFKHPQSAMLREAYAQCLLAKVLRHQARPTRQELAQARAYVEVLLQPAAANNLTAEAREKLLNYQSWLATQQPAP